MARDLYNIAQQLLNSTGCRYIWTEVKSTHGINMYPPPPFKQQYVQGGASILLIQNVLYLYPVLILALSIFSQIHVIKIVVQS